MDQYIFTGSDHEMVQLLSPEGERVNHERFAFSGDDDDIRRFFIEMTLARRLDQEATLLQRKGQLGLWTPLYGQEAAQVGSASALATQDVVFPSYREHAVALVRGVPWTNLLRLFRGCDLGDWEGLEAFKNYAIVIGTQTLHATGYAMGMRLDGADDGAVIVYHGDGATSQGDVNEAYVFAASYQAPVVFFCQNNQWAISEPIARQSIIPLYQRATGFGFPGIRVDGNDALAVHAVTEWALQRARAGEGPTLVEAFTYRMGAHTTADDPTKYRVDSETEHWKLKDPIERVKAYLVRNGLIDDEFLADLAQQADELGEQIRAECPNLPVRSLEQAFDSVYAEPHAILADEKRDWLEFEASFEGV